MIDLAFALMIAGDYYRRGEFSEEYAASRIDEVRALAVQYGIASDVVVDVLIPSARLDPSED